MRIVLPLFLLIFALSASAGEIVLMTSLKLNGMNVRHLEKKFQKAFKGMGHELVIHHKADPKILYGTMTSENTVAVLWVSHAAGESELRPGFKAQDIVLDIWGNDVKNFFTLVPKNLRFLGLVGCQAQRIIDGFRSRGNYVAHPDLEIMSFEKKVRLYSAFDKTVKAAVASLQAVKEPAAAPTSPSIEFTIERSSYEESPSLQAGWVEIGDQVLGFFDLDELVLETGTSLRQDVFEAIARKNIKFFRAKGPEAVEESMGVLTIQTPDHAGTWTLFAKDGRPIGGKDQQLYVYKKSQ